MKRCICLIGCLAVLVAGCGGSGVKGVAANGGHDTCAQYAAQPDATAELSFADNGRTINLKPGQSCVTADGVSMDAGPTG
jgi:hypothetical protein